MPDRRLIGDLDKFHRRPTYLIGDPLEPSTCFISDSSETGMPYRRPIWNQHAQSETDMLHWRPTCLIGEASKTSTCYIWEWHAWLETHQRPRMLHQRPTFLIGDPSEVHRRSIGDLTLLNWRPTCLIWDTWKNDIPIGNWHSPSETYTCPIGGPWETDMTVSLRMKHVEVSAGSPISHVGLRWYSDQACRPPMCLL